MIHYYVEKDGQLFLVRHGGKLDLPARTELPFPITGERKLALRGHDVRYCEPVLDRHPAEWVHKDDVPGREDVTPLVQLAVNRSLVRHVSDAIIEKDGKVLLVKASRGLIKGIWDLPGGFISYGESPEESLAREVREETGLEIRIRKLLHVHTNIYRDHYFIAFIYLCEPAGGTLRAGRDEISEAAWFPVDEAVRVAGKKLFVRESLVKYRDSLKARRA